MGRMMGDMAGEPRELESPDDQSPDEQKIVAFVDRKVEESRSNAARAANESIWMTNIAYLMGFDQLTFDASTRRYVPLNQALPYLPKGRVHENVLLPMAQNRVARLCKVPPRFDTIPDSASEEDKEGALLALDVLVDHWHREEINRKRIALMMWMQECGHAYMKVTYDPNGGDEMNDPETGEFQGREGKVRVDVVSAFEVYPDPLATEMSEEGCAYMVHIKIRPLDYFQANYPERGGLVKPEEVTNMSLQYEARVNSINIYGPGAGMDIGLSGRNTAVEKSYYERPSMKHPKGRHIIVANKVLLKDGELPVGMYPFAKFDDIVIGGKYNAESCVTHARPLQDQYNVTLVRRAEWVRKMLAGKFIAARGHGLLKEALNDRNGEVVEFDPVPNASEPHAMQMPMIPNYAYQETEELKSSIGNIFGLSEVSRGQLPAAGIPAIGMQLLLEQDETRIGIEVEQHEHAYARLGTLILKNVSKNFKTERALRKKDENGNVSVKYYNGASLKGNTHCMVVRGSTVPTSKSLRRQEIMNAYTQGLLGNPGDPAVRQKVMGLLEYGDSTGMWKDYNSTIAQIKRTMEDIKNDIPVVVSEYDNHVLFIQEMNEFRISEKYDLLTPEQKLVFTRTMDEHLEWQTRLMNPAVAMPPKQPMDLTDPLAQAEAETESEVGPLEQNLNSREPMQETAR